MASRRRTSQTRLSAALRCNKAQMVVLSCRLPRTCLQTKVSGPDSAQLNLLDCCAACAYTGLIVAEDESARSP